MTRFLFLAASACAGLWAQAGGEYRYAALSVRAGAAFEARARGGALTLAAQPGQRFNIDKLPVAASASGAMIAGAGGEGGAAEFWVAVRTGEGARLTAGDWSAVLLKIAGGKAAGLTSAFLDFTVNAMGAAAPEITMVSHEAAVDDLCRADAVTWKWAAGSFQLSGVSHAVSVAAGGEAFIAVSTAPAHPSLLIAVRRDRDATTMAIRGAYALSEIGARNSFAFDPSAARFYSTFGTLDTGGGVARLQQRIVPAGGAAPLQFHGQAAYMLTGAGGGTFGPRLEQRRRNFAMSSDGSILIAAQVAEAGQLSLLHGIGVGLRAMQPEPPVLAGKAVRLEDGKTMLFGQNLEGAQPRVAGQPVTVVQSWPNQLLVDAGTAASLPVELDWQGGRTAPVAITVGSAPPDFAAAPGRLNGEATGRVGGAVEFTLTGAPPPAGAIWLFEGMPGQLVASAYSGGLTRVKAMLPKGLAPSRQVNVAISTPGMYVDLGDIVVER